MDGCVNGWIFVTIRKTGDRVTLWLTAHMHVAFFRSIRASHEEADCLGGLASCVCNCDSSIDSQSVDFQANTFDWS